MKCQESQQGELKDADVIHIPRAANVESQQGELKARRTAIAPLWPKRIPTRGIERSDVRELVAEYLSLNPNKGN